MDSTKFNETPEVKLHFLDYWRIIRLRKALILTVFLLVVITTCAMTFWLLPERFASRARIKVEKDNPAVSVNERPLYQPWDPYFLETEFQIITSSSILNDVIKKLHLDERLAKQLGEDRLSLDETYTYLTKQMVRVRQSRNTSLIEIWVTSTDKELAATIANTIAEVYKTYREDLWKKTRQPAVDALKEDLAGLERQAAAMSTNLNALRVSLKIPDLESGGAYNTETLNAESLRFVERALNEAQDEYSRDFHILNGLTNMTQAQLEQSLATVYSGGINDTALNTLTAKLAEAEEKMAAVEAGGYGEQHDKYKEAKKLLETVRGQFKEKVNAIVFGLQTKVRSEKARLDEQIARKKEKIEENNEKAAQYADFYVKRRNLEDLRQIKEKLTSRIFSEEADTKLPLESIVRVTDFAMPSPRPDSPHVILNITLGIIVGLMVGIGLAFFIEYLDTSVKTIDDVERTLQAPVIGVIPQNVGVVMDEGPDSPHAEAYRVLRTNVLFSRKDENWKTISVLSGGAGEGKSTTLLNLATVFAQNGSRVLVVDSDLRRPSIHRMLKLSNDIGLTDFLLNQKKLEEVIQKTKVPELEIIASGKLPNSAMGILSSTQMKELIQKLKSRYDYVFFDAPPLLGMSDASILASEMDMVLQVIQYRRYPQPMTIRAKQMIQKVGGNLLGIVLNNINMSSDEGYYYYSGYYEYHASTQKDSTVVSLSDAAARSGKDQVEIKQKY